MNERHDRETTEKKKSDDKAEEMRELTDDELDEVSAGATSPYVRKKIIKTIIKH